MIWRIRSGFSFWGVFVVLGLVWAHGVSAAADTVVAPRDTLVYKDGDRIQGTLVTRADNVIVFKSDRFGELRVPAADAVVILADKAPGPILKPVVAQGILPPKPAAAKATPAVPTAAKTDATKAAEAKTAADEERVRIWDLFSPGVLTARVRNFFGPWHGRLAFSSEVVSDAAERNNLSTDARLTRKWEKDELLMTARFDYAETNAVRTTDMIKGAASWRHEFNKKQFAHYSPSVEYNRASKRGGVPNEYVLLQQEVGVGYHLFTTPSRKVRLGVAQNLFDIWNSAPKRDHTTRGVQSAFEEVELKLPWQMSLSQRGVWYPVRSKNDGWENRIELSKKLTQTLSTSVRHEIRRNNPDGSAQDFTRLKLLFGFDF